MRKKLGELLVEKEWLTREQLHQALKHQQVFGGRLGTCLLELGLLPEDRLNKAISEQLGFPSASADDQRVIADGILELIPAKLACRSKVVPFERFGNSVSVAMLDTTDLLLQDELGFVVSKRLKIHVAAELRVLEALERHYHCGVEPRFSRIWDRLNRSRFLWQDEGGSAPGGITPGRRRSGEATPPPVSPPPKPPPGWQPSPPPPLESGVTRLAAAGVPVSQPGGGSTDAMPAPRLPRVAPTPSPLLETAGAPGTVAAPQAPAPRRHTAARPPAARSEAAPAALRPSVAPAGPASAPSPARTPARSAAAQPAAPADPAADTTPLVVPASPATLADLEQRLAEVEERDDVAHATLSFLERRFSRRLLFMVRGSEVAAWMGSGEGVDQRELAEVALGFDEPSLFLNLREGSPFYRGPLAKLEAHQRLARVWGGKLPRECLVLPVRVKKRMVAAVYCDRGSEGLTGVDLEELQAMAAAMGHAFETVLRKRKGH
jgi:hypothetical protein